MKTTFMFLFFILSASAFGCADLSGEYVNEEFGTYYSIAQDGCDSITYIHDEGALTSAVDGNEYLVNEYDIVVEEGKVLAHVSIFESHKWKDKKLITNQRSETQYADGEIESDSGWSETYLNKDSDLVVIYHGRNGSQKVIDKRVK